MEEKEPIEAAVGESTGDECSPRPNTLTLVVEIGIPYALMRTKNRETFKDLMACETLNIADTLMNDAMEAFDRMNGDSK